MNRERIEQAKSLLLAAMDRYGKRFNWFVPRILEEVVAEVDRLTRDELLAASTELLEEQQRRLLS
jgi:hypothetical protein